MRNFWLSPIYSLFSLQFYREVVRSKASLGFKYLAYWSAIGAISGVFLYYFFLMPRVNSFFNWFEKDMPALAYNAEVGLIMSEPSPYAMESQKYGRLVTFDMDASQPTQSQISYSPFYVTAKKIYYEKPSGEMGVFDIARPGRGNGRTVLINDILEKVRASLIPVFGLILGILIFPAVYIYKIINGLLFSLLGFGVNLLRSQKLNYATVLSVTFFASTAMTILSVLSLLPLGRGVSEMVAYISIVLTAGYLFLGIKLTEEK